MNTFMWDSPFTARHLAACRDLGALVSCGCGAPMFPIFSLQCMSTQAADNPACLYTGSAARD